MGDETVAEPRQYWRLLAAATVDHVTRDPAGPPDGELDDVHAMAYAMLKLGEQGYAWTLLFHSTSLSDDEAGERVAAMDRGELGVWGVNGRGDRYHVCGKDFVDDGGTTLQCTDDFEHAGRECNQ